MKNKVKLFMLFILLCLLGLLFCISCYADSKRIPDVIFLTPRQPISPTIDYESIEEENGERFLLTYEAINMQDIEALNKNYDVLLKGTNYLYPYVMNCRIVAGSFFSKDAQKENRKLAVLNKKSAFDVFGNTDITNAEFRIDDEVFTVVGVIDDRDKKNKNVYIPIYYSEKAIDSFTALINSADKTPEAALENKIKPFNINRNLYHFDNFNVLNNSVSLRFALSLKLFFLIALIYFSTQSLKNVIKKLLRLKEQSGQLDFGDLLISNKTTVFTIAFSVIATVGFVVTIVATSLSLFSNILELSDVKNIISLDYSTGFTNFISTFNKLSIYSQGVFTAYIALILFFMILLLITGLKEKSK